MALSTNPWLRKRTKEFIILRYQLEHDWRSAQVQGLFLGYIFSKADWLWVVREWLDEERNKRKPEDK